MPQRDVVKERARRVEQRTAWKRYREEAIVAQNRAMALLEESIAAQEHAETEIAKETAEILRLTDLLPRQREGQ